MATATPKIKGTTVLGIDLGSQLIKVAMVLPNEEEALQILYNDLSDRKTPMVVGYRRGKLLVGAHAQKAALSDPETTYYLLPSLLLGQCPAERQALYSSIYASRLSLSHRLEAVGGGKGEKEMGGEGEGGKLAFNRLIGIAWLNGFNTEGQALPMEHFLAQLLSGIVQHAEQTTSRSVGGVVITVPVGATPSLRQALQDAASMARVPLLGLVHAPAAAALYLGTTIMGKAATTAPADAAPQLHIIYDAGASGCSATLVALSTSNNGQPQIEVKALYKEQNASKPVLSAWEIDRRVAGLLAAKWAQRYPQAPKLVPGRAMNRLLAEAQRVKQILSANTETVAIIEEFEGELTLSEPISRAELEAACANLVPQVALPLERLLAQTGLSLKDDIVSVLPVGGNSRVPWVQAALRQAVGGEQRLAHRLDADESMALGAALLAAHWHPTLRVRPISFRDALPLGSLVLSYHEQADGGQKAGEVDSKHKQVTVFKGPAVATDQRRAVAFKQIEANVEWELREGVEMGEEGAGSGKGEGRLLWSGRLGGAKQVLPAESNNATTAKMKLWVSIDRLGLVRVEPAQLALETDSSSGASTTTPSSSSSSSKSAPSVKLIPLPISEAKSALVLPLNAQLLERLQRQMDEERAEARRLRDRAALRNTIEATIFRHGNLTPEAGIGSWLAEAERAAVASEAAAVEAEMQTMMTEDDAQLAAWWARLEAAETKAAARQAQWEGRPLAMDQLGQLIADARRWLAEQRALSAEERGASHEELDQLGQEADRSESQLQLARGWHANPANRLLDPTITLAQLEQTRVTLRMHLTTLRLKRPPPKKAGHEKEQEDKEPEKDTKIDDDKNEKKPEEETGDSKAQADKAGEAEPGFVEHMEL